MEQPIQLDIQDEIRIIEAQIRECYGRVVYAHKTHEKCADICLNRLDHIKIYQIILSALTSGGLLITIIANEKLVTIFSAIFSALLLGLNLYTKNYNLGEIAQKHKDTADNLWDIRESYLSLLTDMASMAVSVEQVRMTRNSLQNKLILTYKGSPRTNGKAYKDAQAALKKYEDMTFSDAEIDVFLPTPLRRGK